MVLHRPVETTPYFGNFAFSVHPKLSRLTLRLRVDLQTSRKIVPKSRPLGILQSAENRRAKLMSGTVPQCLALLKQLPTTPRHAPGSRRRQTTHAPLQGPTL